LRPSFATLACLALIALVAQASAQQPYTIERTTVTVYRDGAAHVRVEASVDPIEPSVTLPLLSSSIYNVLALDEDDEPLSYEVSGASITVHTLGSSRLVLEYDTDALTSKAAGTWTVSFTTPHQLDLALPEGATILYFNAPPASIRSKGERLVLTLPPGAWEVSYVLEAPPAPSQPQPQPQPQLPQLPLAYLALAIPCVAVATGAILLLRRKRPLALEPLRKEEADVVRFLKERGGRALEAELRQAFPDIPRTTMWRLVKRLEKRGIVIVEKVGAQNVVQLKRSKP